jgi:hypothetical protein
LPLVVPGEVTYWPGWQTAHGTQLDAFVTPLYVPPEQVAQVRSAVALPPELTN